MLADDNFLFLRSQLYSRGNIVKTNFYIKFLLSTVTRLILGRYLLNM